MILGLQKNEAGKYAKTLISAIIKHKVTMITSLFLCATSILAFHHSGGFLPLAWGTLISSLLLLLSLGRLIILQMRHALLKSSNIAGIPPQEFSILKVIPPNAPYTSSVSTPLQEGRYLVTNNPDATLIIERGAPSHLVERLHLQASSRSNPGIARQHLPNEDTALALTGFHKHALSSVPMGLFVVADGMGGHANGKEASQTATHYISSVIEPLLNRATEYPSYMENLKQGVQGANFAIYQRNNSEQQIGAEKKSMMGTTMTAALVIDHTAYIVNVGDSRTYHYRPSVGLQKITNDHSIVASMVSSGVIEPDEIYTHPKRNQIYRCLGEKLNVEIDTFTIDLQENDLLLLCSDGLWEMVRDTEIEHILQISSAQLEFVCATLLQTALKNGGADNVSVVLVRLVGNAPIDGHKEYSTLMYQHCTE